MGSLSAIASASRTRREIDGISRTSAFMAATVKSPTKRCSIATAAVDVFANRDGVRVCAVAQVAADDGLGQHQQFVVVGQPGAGTGAGAQDAEAG